MTARPSPPSPEALAALPDLDACVHCGLCLPVCPTYAIDRRESQNPRGRIAALRTVAEGRAPLTPGLANGLADCLVCRACESACPAGISMERLLSTHRAQSPPTGGELSGRLERWVLEEVIAEPERLELALGLLRAGRGVLARVGVRDLPRRERLAPRSLPAPFEPSPGAPDRGRVTLLRGCVADRLFRPETIAAGKLLAHFGFRVAFDDAGCCGALHRHAGLEQTALELSTAHARELLSSLAEESDHPVVSDSAGCLAALLEPLDDASLLRRLANQATDTPSLLATIELPPPPEPIAGPVAFFAPCHQQHGTQTTAATRALLEQIAPGNVVDLAGEDFCCGAAGTYVVRRPQKSRELGARLRARWERSGSPPVIATGNPGCLLRFESILADRREIEVAHPVTLAARAFGLTGR